MYVPCITMYGRGDPRYKLEEEDRELWYFDDNRTLSIRSSKRRKADMTTLNAHASTGPHHRRVPPPWRHHQAYSQEPFPLQRRSPRRPPRPQGRHPSRRPPRNLRS